MRRVLPRQMGWVLVILRSGVGIPTNASISNRSARSLMPGNGDAMRRRIRSSLRFGMSPRIFWSRTQPESLALSDRGTLRIVAMPVSLNSPHCGHRCWTPHSPLSVVSAGVPHSSQGSLSGITQHNGTGQGRISERARRWENPLRAPYSATSPSRLQNPPRHPAARFAPRASAGPWRGLLWT